MIEEYKQTVEKELKDICNDILSILDQYLIKGLDTGSLNDDEKEALVFYHKM